MVHDVGAHARHPSAAQAGGVWDDRSNGLAPSSPSCHAEVMKTVESQVDAVDYALAAFRDAGVWQVEELTRHHLADVPTLAQALRRFPGDAGTVGLVAVDEDFFLIIRVLAGQTRVLLSDITAADEWELAGSAVDFLGLPEPEDDDDQAPAGHLDLLGDLGVQAMDLGILLDDDLHPDEALSEIARRLGFGEQFDDAVGLTSA